MLYAGRKGVFALNACNLGAAPHTRSRCIMRSRPKRFIGAKRKHQNISVLLVGTGIGAEYRDFRVTNTKRLCDGHVPLGEVAPDLLGSIVRVLLLQIEAL